MTDAPAPSDDTPKYEDAMAKGRRMNKWIVYRRWDSGSIGSAVEIDADTQAEAIQKWIERTFERDVAVIAVPLGDAQPSALHVTATVVSA